MEAWIYKWLPIIFGCHCRDDRSFHFHGKKFPICARCTGEFIGIVISVISCFFFRISVILSFVLLIPMVADGFIQALTSYESNNFKRCVTGFLFGYGVFMLFAISTVAVYNSGKNFGS